MSTMNCVWTPSRVTVAVDTAAGIAKGLQGTPGLKPGSISKALPLPGLGLLLAGRGPAMLVPFLAFITTMEAASQGWDVDAVLDNMPAMIGGAQAQARADLARLGQPTDFAEAFEVLAVCWSARRGRMAALCWSKDSAADALELFELDGGWQARLAPDFGIVDERNPPTNDSQHMALVRRQVAEAQARGETGCGGRLLIAECTRSRMSVVDHGEIHVRPAPAAHP